jgi:hypothetical protein
MLYGIDRSHGAAIRDMERWHATQRSRLRQLVMRMAVEYTGIELFVASFHGSVVMVR